MLPHMDTVGHITMGCPQSSRVFKQSLALMKGDHSHKEIKGGEVAS